MFTDSCEGYATYRDGQTSTISRDGAGIFRTSRRARGGAHDSRERIGPEFLHSLRISLAENARRAHVGVHDSADGFHAALDRFPHRDAGVLGFEHPLEQAIHLAAPPADAFGDGNRVPLELSDLLAADFEVREL